MRRIKRMKAEGETSIGQGTKLAKALREVLNGYLLVAASVARRHIGDERVWDNLARSVDEGLGRKVG
jgi:hypothetical protein